MVIALESWIQLRETWCYHVLLSTFLQTDQNVSFVNQVLDLFLLLHLLKIDHFQSIFALWRREWQYAPNIIFVVQLLKCPLRIRLERSSNTGFLFHVVVIVKAFLWFLLLKLFRNFRIVLVLDKPHLAEMTYSKRVCSCLALEVIQLQWPLSIDL